MLHRTHNTREWILVIAFIVFTLSFMLWVLLESRELFSILSGTQ